MSHRQSFADRVRAMKVLAENLTASGNLILKFAEQVADEAICMAAAQRRFEERAAKTKKADR